MSIGPVSRKKASAHRNIILPYVERDSRDVSLVIPAPSGLAPDVFDYFELLLELNIYLYEEAHIFEENGWCCILML